MKSVWSPSPLEDPHISCQATASTAAELKHLPLEEIKARCPEEVEDARMYVSWQRDHGGSGLQKVDFKRFWATKMVTKIHRLWSNL